MSSEGLGELFKGDSAEMCAGKFSLVSMGGQRMVKRAHMVSANPHRRKRNSFSFSWKFVSNIHFVALAMVGLAFLSATLNGS
jgi:hypothetical protein